jgi:hypothetical protein
VGMVSAKVTVYMKPFLIPDSHRDLLDGYPVEQKQKEARVIVKIEQLNISRDAIFK